MNDSHFLAEIPKSLQTVDDGTLDVELHDLYANTLSQLSSLSVSKKKKEK
jgi:hypothetical protein